MKLRIYILAAIFGGLFTNITAQSGTIKGYVRDKLTNQPVAFANIVVANTTNGTATNIDGYFEIGNIADEFVRLNISCLGYEPLTSSPINVSKVKATTINFEMEPTSKNLGEVKVSAQRFALKPESPVSLQSIGIDLIEKSAGVNRDISKVLQSFPGVGGAVSYRNDLIVRGGGPSENRFYLDGIEVPVLNHFSTQGASGGSIGIFNVDFIRSVDFYSGAFPASRGNALSSVIEFKQIDGNSDKPSFKASLGASEMSFSTNGPLGDKTTLIASARRSYLQFLFKQLGLPFLPTFNDFSFKTKTRFNQKNELTLLGVGAIDHSRLNKVDNPDEEMAYTLGYLPEYDQWNYTVGASFKHFFNQSYLTLVASRNVLNNQAFKYANNIKAPQNRLYDYGSSETENKMRAELTARPREFSINAGFNLELAEYTNQTYSKQFVNNASVVVDYTSTLPVFKYGMFGNVAHPLFEQRMTVSVGFRFDAADYSTQMSNPFDQFSPRISATYRISSPLTLSASAGRYYQLPAYTMLGYRNGNSDWLNRDNGIKYINSDHYIVGAEYKPNDNTRISLEGFVKRYGNYPFSVADQISMASKGSGYGIFGDEEVTPTSEGRTQGFELLVRRQTLQGLSLMMAYTFVRSEFTDSNGKYVPSSWDSKHLLTATVNKKLKRNWSMGLKWRFVGGLPYTPYDMERSSYVEAWDVKNQAYLDYSRFNTLRGNSFHQLDLRIDKTYAFKGWSLGMYFDVQNAYNQKTAGQPTVLLDRDTNGSPIVLNPDAPKNEQRYRLKSLDLESGTVLPAIGLILEF